MRNGWFTLVVVLLFFAVLQCIVTTGGQLPKLGINQYQNDTQIQQPLIALPSTCIVKKVYDGDTIGCDFNGNGQVEGAGERVRLLQIDAPETQFSPKNKTGVDEAGAQEAKQALKRYVNNKAVILKYDLNPLDRYGRKLAFVYLSPQGQQKSVNLLLTEQGLVKTMFISPNAAYKADFMAAQAQAQKSKLGLWH